MLRGVVLVLLTLKNASFAYPSTYVLLSRFLKKEKKKKNEKEEKVTMMIINAYQSAKTRMNCIHPSFFQDPVA